jgi:hypothetical protein
MTSTNVSHLKKTFATAVKLFSTHPLLPSLYPSLSPSICIATNINVKTFGSATLKFSSELVEREIEKNDQGVPQYSHSTNSSKTLFCYYNTLAT